MVVIFLKINCTPKKKTILVNEAYFGMLILPFWEIFLPYIESIATIDYRD